MNQRTYKYDVAVVYRIYPKMSKPALGLPFSDDKERMAEVCLQSFRRSLGDLRAKVWVLLDGCPPSYAGMFRRAFVPEDLVLEPLPGIGNHGTFNRQIEILLHQQDAELVYFAEDDYFYLPDQFRLMTEFIQGNADADFVSPFDHMDCYTQELHRRPTWLRVFQDRHWRTAGSTCLTFLTTKSILRQTQRIFRSYARRNFDCSLWLSLTKENVLHPVDFLRWTVRQPLFAKIIAKAWFFGWPQILFGKRRKLWSPVPGVATHMDFHALSPTIDWPALMQEQARSPETVRQ
ncbi:MAG TPA: glycosyltransferase family 2 protein [Candidatus Angelobacter sp.]|nr:glycosyltransferase family 2 protein [Candidatus Angelobacter sp.]